MRELIGQFEGQFIVAEIEQQWHNLLTNYKREKQREESSKSSGSGSSEICTCSWPYYHSMSFTDNTHEMDEQENSLSPPANPEKKLPIKASSRDDEISAKTDSLKTLTNQMAHGASNTNNFPKQNGFTLEDKARRFAQSVVDNLL